MLVKSFFNLCDFITTHIVCTEHAVTVTIFTICHLVENEKGLTVNLSHLSVSPAQSSNCHAWKAYVWIYNL